jgi:hypothetical protein
MIFSEDTSLINCFRCSLHCKYNLSFFPKNLHLLLRKYDLFSMGQCQIRLSDINTNKKYKAFTRGYESCLFEGLVKNKSNIQDFVLNIVLDNEKLKEAIERIKKNNEQKNIDYFE